MTSTDPSLPSAFYRRSAEAKAFLIPTCKDCNQPHWYPRLLCPHCRSGAIEFRPSSGIGEIYACSTRKDTDLPPTLAYVQIDGICVLTRVSAKTEPVIGDKVRAVIASPDALPFHFEKVE